MRKWIIDNNISTNIELNKLEKSIKNQVKNDKNQAWTSLLLEINRDKRKAIFYKVF